MNVIVRTVIPLERAAACIVDLSNEYVGVVNFLPTSASVIKLLREPKSRGISLNLSKNHLKRYHMQILVNLWALTIRC